MKHTTLFLLPFALSAFFSQAQQVQTLKTELSSPPKANGEAFLVKNFVKANGGTTDIFSSQTKKRDYSVPQNYMGNQVAESGDLYFGIIAYYNDGVFDVKKFSEDGFAAEKPGYGKYSEYIELPIEITLKAGQEYVVSFKVSLADKSSYAISGLGAYFSSSPVKETSNARLKHTPQISSSIIINNKDNWTEISGKFTAKGDEKYITVGSFEKDMKTSKVISDGELNNRKAYYYISTITLTEYQKPDVDKDGIVDEEDKCPTVKGIAKFAGCPDTDNDGIEDANDKCPEIAGKAEFNGCADTDGDGIADPDDKCPAVAGIKDNQGCPEVKISAKAKEIFQKAMAGIQFETGKDVIKKSSYGILDNVVTVLKENPDWNIEVQGHTDNVGKYESNKTLSEKRAIAVKNYLASKGVTNSMTSHGYGSDKPMADNKTSKGRALNRRVEFKVTYLQ